MLTSARRTIDLCATQPVSSGPTLTGTFFVSSIIKSDKTMYKHSPSLIPVALFLGFGASGVQAAVMDCRSESDVQITQIATSDGNPISQSPTSGVPINASGCIHAGNRNPSPVRTGFGGDNRGLKNEGDLNTWGKYGEYGAFVTEDDLQALRDPDVAEDPGWIFVGKKDVNGSTDWGTIRNGDNTFSFESFFDDFSDLLQITPGDGCDGGHCGTWTYTPPKDYPDDLLSVIGFDRIFDQLAVVFKSGPESMIYNFKVSDLFDQTPEENYSYSGVWDTSGSMFNSRGRNNSPYGLSNYTLFLRDPVAQPFSDDPQPNPVPTPATLILFAFGLIGLGAFQKRRA